MITEYERDRFFTWLGRVTTGSLDQVWEAGTELLAAADFARRYPHIPGAQIERAIVYQNAVKAASTLGLQIKLEPLVKQWRLGVTAPDKTWYPVPA